MKNYKYIFFDLFDTLINFDYEKLPEISVDGEKHNSTSGLVYDVLQKYHPEISFDIFYKPFMETYSEFQAIKLIEYREYPNADRFKLLMSKLSVDDSQGNKDMIEEMVIAHMQGLASATVLPDGNIDAMEYLKEKGYKFALISNFDYAPTAYKLLEKYDLKKYFEQIFVSIEVGWRKPSKKIFQSALDGCNINNEEVIHVGDNFGADIVGAYDIGIDTIWINRKVEELKHEYASPNYIIFKLPEITSLF